MGIGGHILSQKVNKLVSYLRGVDGQEKIQIKQIEKLLDQLNRVMKRVQIFEKDIFQNCIQTLDKSLSNEEISDQLKDILFLIQDQTYTLFDSGEMDEIDFENIITSSEAIIEHSYSSIISPFPFHNCYSIEDVKAFIDIVHMINPEAVISIKVSPSSDIEFIAAGLARIAKDNTEEIVKKHFGADYSRIAAEELNAYREEYGMKMAYQLRE